MGRLKSTPRQKQRRPTSTKSPPSTYPSVWTKEYYDPAQPGAYSGAASYYRHASTPPKSKTQLKQWLTEQETYTLHYPIQRHFPRRAVVVSGPYDQWQADLCDLSRLRRLNKGVCFLLTVIDVFSKVAHVRALKNKTGGALVSAFQDILEHSPQTPRRLQTDKGSEFMNKLFQQFLKTKGIVFFTSENEDIKASVVERFNRTLKAKMYRYFTHHNTRRYVDVLQALVDNYNSSYHRSIRTQPKLVGPHNQHKVYAALYGCAMKKAFEKRPPPKLALGDRVRLAQARHTFQKGYLPRWSQELFTIHQRLNTHPYVYKIRDDRGEVVRGNFYAPELQKVVDSGVYKIEKIIRRHGQNVLVKWLGYSDDFNSWIPATAINKRYKK